MHETPESAAVEVRPLALAVCLLFAAASRAGGAPPIEYRVAAEYPHDPAAFTQGLVSDGDALYESTGLRGRSSLRKVEPATGRIVRKRSLSDRLFAEGLALVGDELYQLTWTAGSRIRHAAEGLFARARVPLRGGRLGPRLRRRESW